MGSDARCREIVASHLAAGTGPKDVQGVGTFSDLDARLCRHTYFEKVHKPVRKIQKVVYDLRAQRRDLNDSKQRLKVVTEAVWRRQQREEDKKLIAKGLASNNLGAMKKGKK